MAAIAAFHGALTNLSSNFPFTVDLLRENCVLFSREQKSVRAERCLEYVTHLYKTSHMSQKT